MPSWLEPGRCSSCKFCGMDMDMGPYCAHPNVTADHPYGLNLNQAVQIHCGPDLKLRVPRDQEEVKQDG